MKTHFDHLLEVIPDLGKRDVLDLGSGKGNFLVDVVCRGGKATGIEVYKPYIEASLQLAKEKGVSVIVKEGVGEHLPFQDQQFDFVNMSEVIEHVKNPEKVLSEVYRVLRLNGKVYMSVPNRFGSKDPHFHLYILNWLPRNIAPFVITLCGRHKTYTDDTGYQKIQEMHYMTFPAIRKLGEKTNFIVEDIREKKIAKKYNQHRIVCRCLIRIYHLIRFCFLNSFHILLTKK